jgi:2-dehydropantoate 2-reductase
MSANILIVGCGAIGGLFAAALSSVAKVTAFDTNSEHAKAINTQGLRVTGKNPRTVHIAATSDPASLKNTAFAAVIFLTKSKTTAAALDNCIRRWLAIPRLSRCRMAWATQ